MRNQRGDPLSSVRVLVVDDLGAPNGRGTVGSNLKRRDGSKSSQILTADQRKLADNHYIESFIESSAALGDPVKSRIRLLITFVNTGNGGET